MRNKNTFWVCIHRQGGVWPQTFSCPSPEGDQTPAGGISGTLLAVVETLRIRVLPRPVGGRAEEGTHMNCRHILGEPGRIFVRSATNPEQEHLVDLLEHACGCPSFTCRNRKYRELFGHNFTCRHLREHAL